MVEVELGNDLMSQVELTGGKLPDDISTKELKFDDRGTPHVMYRDDNGKLLKDTPIKQSASMEEKVDYNAETYNEFKSLQEINESGGRKANALFSLAVCIILISFLFVLGTLLMR